ncbi:unnamed protein product [Symbiodinium natans]|uniref:Uncharacterized protein n=1 Tax=Symbiodinium natans TaxID=878477 RepID=A0A812Q1K7_9DINO|nr:unnamed protein product [Symbiodinium natans]
MHPTRYIDGIANQEDGLSQSINRFRHHTIRAKLLHQSRWRPLEMEYQQSLGTNHLTDVEILPGRQAQSAATVTTCPSTITPASTIQEHADQFQRRYPSRQAHPLDQATGMFTQANDENNPSFRTYQYHGTDKYPIMMNLYVKIAPGHRSETPESTRVAPWSPACSRYTTAWDKKWNHIRFRNTMITVIFSLFYQSTNLNREDGTPVIRYYPNRMNFLPKQLVHKFPSIQQETQRSILMSWNEYINDPATHVQMLRHAESLNEHSKKSRRHQVKTLLRDILTGPSGIRILQFTAYQFRMMIRKGTNPDLTTMPNIYQLWHWGYIKFKSVNEELWIFTHNFADPQTMARLEQTCVHFHRIWASQVVPSTAGLVPILPRTQDLCVIVHNTNPPFHQPMVAKHNTISGIMTSQAVSNIVFRKVHADLQLHRTWPSVDSALQPEYEDDTFLIPEAWPTNIWTVCNSAHATAAHVLHRLWDPLIFTFADPCHASYHQDTKHSSQPHLTEKFYKIDNEGHIPMIGIPASSIKEGRADWAWFQFQHEPRTPFRWLPIPLASTTLTRNHSVYWIKYHQREQVQRHHAQHIHQPSWFTLDGVFTPFQQDPPLEADQAVPTPTQQEWEEFIDHRRALLELQRCTTADRQDQSHEWHHVR